MRETIHSFAVRSATMGALLVSGCVDTGQTLVGYPAHGRGTGSGAPEVDGWQVDLSRAGLAFGPVYFCATRSASADLCPVAVNEMTSVGWIDLLDDEEQDLGTVEGVTGYLGSATFDYGITWLPTESRPAAKPGAVNGHSLILEGSATRADQQIDFVATIDLTPPRRGGNVVDGHAVDEDLTKDVTDLRIEVDGDRFVAALDFEELALVPENPVFVMPGMRSYEAIVIAVTTNAPPMFTWEFEP